MLYSSENMEVKWIPMYPVFVVLVRFCPLCPQMVLPHGLCWHNCTIPSNKFTNFAKSQSHGVENFWKQYLYNHNSTFLNTSNCMKGCNCNSFVHQTPQNITLIKNLQKYTTESPTCATITCKNCIFKSLRHFCNTNFKLALGYSLLLRLNNQPHIFLILRPPSLLHSIFEQFPHILNGIQVKWLCWPLNLLKIMVLSPIYCNLTPMHKNAIFHEYNLANAFLFF